MAEVVAAMMVAIVSNVSRRQGKNFIFDLYFIS
jgi:hypothetical protein